MINSDVIKIGDVDIRINSIHKANCKDDPLDWLKSTFELSFDSSDYVDIYFKKSLKTGYVIGDIIKLYTSSKHAFQLGVGMVADINSDTYNVVHGAASLYQEKAILFLGRGGSGKSTLSSIISDSKTIDDDILMLGSDFVETIGTYGYITTPKDGKKYRLPTNISGKFEISNVFILDKKLPGGHIEQVTNELSRRYLVPDTLSQKNVNMYLTLPKVTLDDTINCYKIGTNGNLEETKQLVEDVVNGIYKF